MAERTVGEVLRGSTRRCSVLGVTVAHEQCGTGDPRVAADEASDGRVVLSAEYNEGRGNCDDVGLLTTIAVELDRPQDRQIRSWS